jgi:hypothetical protein
MKDVVRQAFVPLTVEFEGGYIDWMFPDILGLISTGFGLLLEPMGLAIGLPWRLPDGSLAGRDEIAAEWAKLNNFVDNHPGSEKWSWKKFESHTTLRLGREGLYQAFQGKMNHCDEVLRAGFAEWDEWPANVQLAAMSMAWAVGPGFYSPAAGPRHFPKLTAALRARDWRTASVECFMPEEEKNPGIIPRNRANRLLFTNAVIAADMGLDPGVLYYPDVLELPADREPETQPERHVDWDIVHPPVPLDSPSLDSSIPPPPDEAA